MCLIVWSSLRRSFTLREIRRLEFIWLYMPSWSSQMRRGGSFYRCFHWRWNRVGMLVIEVVDLVTSLLFADLVAPLVCLFSVMRWYISGTDPPIMFSPQRTYYTNVVFYPLYPFSQFRTFTKRPNETTVYVSQEVHVTSSNQSQSFKIN